MSCCCGCCVTVPNVCTSPGILNTVAADTIGLLWRAASGTVDPWTKKELQANQTCGMIKAGANPCDAAQQSACDVTDTLRSTPGGSSCPANVMCGIKKSVSTGLCITNNLGKTILFIGLGALLLLLVFNKVVKD